MLDLLLRYVNGRNMVVAGLMLASLPFAIRGAKRGRDLYMRAAYPPVLDAGTSAEDIKALLDKREDEKVQAEYRRVKGLLDDAKKLGYAVGALEWNVNQAMSRNLPGRRAHTLELLAKAEMEIPRRKVQYIPMFERAPDDTMTDDDAPPTHGAVTRTKTQGRSKAPPTKAKRKRRSSG